MLLEEGEIVRDVYEVERFLGEGAFAEVYRVRHKFLGRQALKVFKSPGVTREETERLLAEAVILSQIGHPNIIRVFDAGVIPTRIGSCGFVTMEYIAGGNLESYWRSHGSRLVPIGDSVEIIRQVCRGLAVAHREQPPIIHRDVKPQNILVGYDAGGLRVRVSDFGLARHVNPLTLLASARGTRAFKPPEFLANVDSCAADVWGIGTTLYLLLTDHLPYPELADTEITDARKLERPVTFPSRHNVEADDELDRIVCRALAFKPVDRHSDAQEMLEDLNKWKPKPPAEEGPAAGSKGQPDGAPDPAAPRRAEAARRKLAEALRLSQAPARLEEAADLLEEALNENPELRPEHEYRLKLWRRKITM